VLESRENYCKKRDNNTATRTGEKNIKIRTQAIHHLKVLNSSRRTLEYGTPLLGQNGKEKD
jgi:hypothetical protein